MEHNLEPISEPKHKIFLSHSGEQKEFVELLCERLESRCHTPFFDKRSSSLPKAETFPNLIFQVVEQCEMMVVVISDDFFMSKWPMMELQTFVQAVEAMKDKPSNTREKYILPLFYKLSVEEFRDKERREKWEKTWMVAKEGAKRRQIDADAWEKAVDVLGTYNGIEYKSSGIRDYLDEIVSHICDKIIADVKWDDSHVQGRSSICKVLRENIQSVGCLEEFGCKILGIFGVGGVGKTTICKAMCNELSIEYEGRVCHIELETQVRTSQATMSIVVGSLRKLVMLLTNKNSEFVQKLDEEQCKYILRNSGNSRKTFIAIDNVWDNHASIKQAKTILEIPNFHEESLVIVTARSRDTLEMLGICGDVCFEMPELGEADATKLFLYHAAGGKQFGGENDKRDILRCIKKCYFDKSGGNGEYHYHPLALLSLGVQLGCVGKKPSEWVEKLPRVRNFNYLGGENPVFDILRSSFNMLRACEQSLFMDLVVYNPFLYLGYNCDFERFWEFMVAYLCVVHEVGEDGLKSMFDGLKRKGLLQDVDWTFRRIIVHDLYLQFAELESRGELDDLEDLDHRRCMNISRRNLIELERSPSGKCWQRLSRVYIHDKGDDHQQLDYQIQMDWRFSNVQVLKLESFNLNLTSLNVEALKCLRSLTILCVQNLEKIEGLGGLRNLTFFEFINGNDDTIIEELPASLKLVYIEGYRYDSLNPGILSQCSNLCKLELHDIEAVELDLSSCSSLQSVLFNDVRELRSLDLSSCSTLESVELQEVESLHTFALPNPRVACGLKSFKVYNCQTLADILGLDELVGLESLALLDTPFQHFPDVRKWTKLQVLELELKAELYLEQERQGEVEGAGCFFPPQLRELKYSCASTKAPNLRGCTHLEVLELNIEFHDDDGLATNLKCLEDLPALRSLSLEGCRLLSRPDLSLSLLGCRVLSGWPDLSRSRKLEEIKLRSCQIELHENDIRMLTLLPLLGPLKICYQHLKLDLVRRKVLSWSYRTFGWEESDLGTPPITLIRSNRLL